MKNIIFLFIIILFLFNCNLLEPSQIIIENLSDYEILVIMDQGNNKEFKLKKNKTDFNLCSPGNIILNIIIEQLGYNKEFPIKINYQEKKKISFNLE